MLRSMVRAVSGKLSAIALGKSAVPKTCQIPGLREKYSDLGILRGSGVFVEIGAYDGETYSNTSFLADQGWRGLYVEPIPRFCRLISIRHALNEVAVENVAIADATGTCTFQFMGALSTMNASSVEAYQRISWARSSTEVAKVVEVKTDRLDSVLARHAIPDDFQLMIVDVEGGEESIVASLLESRWRPRVLVIELCDVHPDFSGATELQASHQRVRRSIIGSNYQQFYSDSINSIFYRA
jgi:FkbM family methyltransferase